MRIAVVGAGGLGGYFGARLARAGEDVHFLARGAHLAAMREGGLRIRSVFGDFALTPAQTNSTEDPADIGPSQVILFTVKSYDTDTAAASLPPLLGPETAVISLQNGIDNEEKLAGRIGWEHVAGGVAYIFAGIAEPGVVLHTGGPARILFGEMDGRSTQRLEAFLVACQRAAIDAALIPDIRVALWTKYAFICAQAGLTAATREPIGAVRETPPTWDLFRQVLAEAASVARAEDVPLPADIVDRQLAMAKDLDRSLYSSLYNDLIAERRMELEALLGELVRRAQRAGVPAPASSALYAVLLPQANAFGQVPKRREPWRLNSDGGVGIGPKEPVRAREAASRCTTPTGSTRCARTRTSDRFTGRMLEHRCRVLPEWRGKGIGRVLLAEAQAAARRRALTRPPTDLPAVFDSWVSETETATVRLLTRVGYRPARYEFSIVRPTLDDPPDDALPPGIELRPVRPEDALPVLQALDEAFRDEPTYAAQTDEQLETWAASPIGGQIDVWQVAWAGDEVVGGVLGHIDEDENRFNGRGRGYTQGIFTRRPWRGRGVATALIGRSLRELARRGMTEAALGVDADNPSAALRLYEKAGFLRDKVMIVFARLVES